MGGSGPVDQLVQHAGEMTLDEAADLYRAYAAHILIQGSDAERRALAHARASAARTQRTDEYEHARHLAAAAWRAALPSAAGPWLIVGRAIANAAGALVLQGTLDDRSYQVLYGPWRQAIGTLVAVGPGIGGARAGPAALVGGGRRRT
jgi:hypothetical protein